MPLFGSKKKKKNEDIEAPEEDGLFMARGSEKLASDAALASSEDGEDSEPDLAALTGDDPLDLSAPEDEAEETSAEAAPEPPKAEEPSGADDILSAFEDDEESGDLADLTKDLEDVPMAELMDELRSIRATLPPEALENSENVG